MLKPNSCFNKRIIRVDTNSLISCRAHFDFGIVLRIATPGANGVMVAEEREIEEEGVNERNRKREREEEGLKRREIKKGQIIR